jgi:hypothetical protein
MKADDIDKTASKALLHLSAYEEEHTECSETSANKIQKQGNYPEESIKHSEHGKSLKSRSKALVAYMYVHTRMP